MPINVSYDASPAVQARTQNIAGRSFGNRRLGEMYNRQYQGNRALDQRQSIIDQRQQEFEADQLNAAYDLPDEGGFEYSPRAKKELARIDDEITENQIDTNLDDEQRQDVLDQLNKRRARIKPSPRGPGRKQLSPQQQYAATHAWSGGREGAGQFLAQDDKGNWGVDKTWQAQQNVIASARADALKAAMAMKKSGGKDAEDVDRFASPEEAETYANDLVDRQFKLGKYGAADGSFEEGIRAERDPDRAGAGPAGQPQSAAAPQEEIPDRSGPKQRALDQQRREGERDRAREQELSGGFAPRQEEFPIVDRIRREMEEGEQVAANEKIAGQRKKMSRGVIGAETVLQQLMQKYGDNVGNMNRHDALMFREALDELKPHFRPPK